MKPSKNQMITCPAHLRNNSPGQWFSNSISITWEHVINAHSQAQLRSIKSETLGVGTGKLFYQLFPGITIHATI